MNNNNNQKIIEKLKLIQINLHNCMIASSTLAQFMLENNIDLQVKVFGCTLGILMNGISI
jgi:hypothetical protein